jgi:hypothetical protein
MEEARKIVTEMLQRQPDYTLTTERLRPFKNPEVLRSLIADLQAAGLKDREKPFVVIPALPQEGAA